MAETIALPESDHFSCAFHEFAVHDLDSHLSIRDAILVWEGLENVWVKVFYYVVEHRRHHLLLQPITRPLSPSPTILLQKDLKRSESHESRCDSHNHSAFLHFWIAIIEFVTIDLGLIRDDK